MGAAKNKVATGVESLVNSLGDKRAGRGGTPKKCALLCNQASVLPDYRHVLDVLDEVAPGLVARVFFPQHGFFGEKQDNMVESGHLTDALGRPVYSLYGEARKPTPAMLEGLGTIYVDLVDAGTRVYTFAQTLSLVMEAAGQCGVGVTVLDRPNPIGGAEVEGNILDADCASFVGLHPVPLRHGLTMGELAMLVKSRLPEPPELEVRPVSGWSRDMYHPETGLPWVPPSPNMPSPETAWLYPGQVIWEGTNVSEGRGTTRPFHLVGAPFVEAEVLHKDLLSRDLPGLAFRKAWFEPTFNKWAGQLCGGLELFPLDRTFKPLLTSLTILEIMFRRWPGAVEHKAPPYEYERERRPFDLIMGRKGIFEALRDGGSAKDLCAGFEAEAAAFYELTRPFKLY
ncbi:MAG: DUF1343 domain-containing protein [Deltaproteobacteria bacterium]|jgi:uncharacterized protein YbbC (DUF1343 family)|nr:DUF1343 domain-containing protein [Deltaproteobacteria bacterium]